MRPPKPVVSTGATLCFEDAVVDGLPAGTIAEEVDGVEREVEGGFVVTSGASCVTVGSGGAFVAARVGVVVAVGVTTGSGGTGSSRRTACVAVCDGDSVSAERPAPGVCVLVRVTATMIARNPIAAMADAAMTTGKRDIFGCARDKPHAAAVPDAGVGATTAAFGDDAARIKPGSEPLISVRPSDDTLADV